MAAMDDQKLLNSQGSAQRPRRLRASEAIRGLVEETRLSPKQLVMPYFIQPGKNTSTAIEAMPGQFRWTGDLLLKQAEHLLKAGVKSVLLFGLPSTKDEEGSEAWSEHGTVQQAIRLLKRNFPELLVISDVCLCAYTDHGHCGLINEKGEIDNDSTLDLLAKTALSHAEAGADIVAPSDMMDGRIAAIRRILDEQQFTQTAIMSYSVKYASAFYGPFRDAAHSAPQKSSGSREIPKDRKSYQMNPANLREAFREAALDVHEGADILMVKPALAYLDVIQELSRRLDLPIAAYSVSGEYVMAKAAASQGFMDEKAVVMEMLTSMARAGARILITYHALEAAAWIRR